ncbi:ferredoxin [bacterium BMS3Abin02]|nr:ferredoxin [bacterium BMS3Abin02]HDH24893.1 4Fe-4S dicluster domain-containing protein [Actinomycetota bacterium]
MIGEHVPSSDLDRCLNLVHRRAGCRLCADACPVDAISLEHPAPILDTETCVACGVCVAVCPTDVFGEEDRTEPTLLRAVSLYAPDELGVVCVRRTNPREAPVPTATVVTHRSCLGSLDMGDLLKLSDQGNRPIVLDDTLCEECPIGSAHTVITTTADSVNALLGNPKAILLASETAGTSGVREIIDGAHPHFTRRALFGLVRDRAAELADRDPVGSVPSSRARLLAHLPMVDEMETGQVPFADVRIDPDACTACGACVQFCPTDALMMPPGDEDFAISFLPASCLDCGICAVACPDSAVSFGDRIEGLNNVRTLVAGALAACESCETPTVSKVGADGRILCTWCRHGAGAVRPLHDEAGLFDDLLGRLDD